MMYEEALEKWGRGRLEAVYSDIRVVGPITVRKILGEIIEAGGGTVSK